jgi:hypothetical protein
MTAFILGLAAGQLLCGPPRRDPPGPLTMIGTTE